MRRFLLQTPPGPDGRARLAGREAHHARNVLRLQPGDDIMLVDGQGTEMTGRITGMDRDGLDLEIIVSRTAATEPRLQLDLGLAILKPDLMDLVVQKGTELGLSRLVPLETERTAIKIPADRVVRRCERWRQISLEAVKQCRRGKPLVVEAPASLNDFLRGSWSADLKIMLHPGQDGPESAEWRAILDRRPKPRRVAALIGPAGGFSENEAALAVAAGFERLRLGPRILRAETAAIALMALLGFELGDLADLS